MGPPTIGTSPASLTAVGIYKKNDQPHVHRELLKYKKASDRIFHGARFVSMATDASKVGDLGVLNTVLLEPKTGVAAFAAPQALGGRSGGVRAVASQ